MKRNNGAKLKRLFFCLLLAAGVVQFANAAKTLEEGSQIRKGFFGNLALAIALDEVALPKVRYLDDPHRVILQFEQLDLSAFAKLVSSGKNKQSILVDQGNEGEGSLIVIIGEKPFRVKNMEIENHATSKLLKVEFEDIKKEEFSELTRTLRFEERVLASISKETVTGANELPLVVIDPGHGGIDPGAERGGVAEKEITLEVSKIVSEYLLKTNRYRVGLTRNEDRFVSLAARRRFPEQIGADMFLSIHANTVEEGEASGTTIYFLSSEASDIAAEHFSKFENRIDVFRGLYALEHETDVNMALFDLAQRQSDEKSRRFAEIMQANWKNVHQTGEARLGSAAFAVLKAPEVPSLLLEIGYLTDAGDRGRMQDPAWQRDLAARILSALDAYFYPSGS